MDLTRIKLKRGESEQTIQQANDKEQAGMDIMYQAELKRYLDRTETLER